MVYMATREIKVQICDICGKETNTTKVPVPVRWTTEQTEGRPVKPYIQVERIDLCEACLSKIVKVRATGAQGNNTYYID